MLPLRKNSDEDLEREAFGRERYHLDRLDRFPDSLSLEMVTNLIDRLSAVIPLLDEEKRPKLQKYLDVLCSFIKELRDKCVESNLRLVGRVVQTQFYLRLKSKSIEVSDALQEGSIGLMTAAFLYDPIRGFAFSTYAIWWIQCFLRKLLTKSALIHIPPYLNDTEENLREKNKDKEKGNGNERGKDTPSYYSRWEKAQKARFISSISANYWPGKRKAKDIELEDLAADNHTETIDNRLDIENLLDYLPPIERRIVELRYLEGCTLGEVTNVLYREGLTPTKVTRERARQREIKALADLKEIAQEWQGNLEEEDYEG